MQETKIYDYMVRSGTVTCNWAGAEQTIPISIGIKPRNKESEISACCVLTSAKGGLRAEVLIDNDTGLPLRIVSVSLDTTILLPDNTPFFCNGYQSWSNSGLYGNNKSFARPAVFCPKLLRKSGDYDFYHYTKKTLHSWTYTYFDAPLGYTLLASLDESFAYTYFEFYAETNKRGINVRIRKDCDGLILPPVPRTSALEVPPQKISDVFITTGNELNCWDRYFELFYENNAKIGLHNKSKPALAWDSWYFMYDQIEENRLMDVLKDYKIRQIPLDYFIIGRGYEKEFGDWTKPSEKFPGGMDRVVKAIKSAGYKPGLTISPFVCSARSGLYNERKELLAKDRKGRLICIGRSRDLGGKLYLLDLYNPEAKKYLKRYIHTLISEWGIEVLKMDFLYAAGFNSGDHCKRTRAQAVFHALNLLKEYAEDTPVIACGVPLGSCFGLFEYCSVSPDLSADWDGSRSRFLLKSIRERESTQNAITTSIARRHLDGRAFSSDAVAFSLRKYKIRITGMQQEALFKTSIIFGGLICGSDSIGSYSGDLLETYRQAIVHRCSRSNDKRVLSVKNVEQAIVVKYVLKNEFKEDLIPGVQL